MRATYIWHHVVFVSLLGVPTLQYEWGGLQYYLLFFLFGLSGAVMYPFLAAEQCSLRLLIFRESQITMIMYTFVRTSDILYYVGAGCVLLYEDRLKHLLHVVPFKVVMLQLITPSINVLYYGFEMYRRHESGKVRVFKI